MRQGNNPRRGRGRPGRRPNVPTRAQNFESNGPEGRVRGNASQVYEKYLQLARDAQSGGDRVLAESFQQHAEHYYRIINDSTEPGRPQPREQRQEGRQEDGEETVVEGDRESNGAGRREQGERQNSRYEDRRQQARAGDPRYTERSEDFGTEAGESQQQAGGAEEALADDGASRESTEADAASQPAAAGEEEATPRRTRRSVGRRSKKADNEGEDAGLLKMLGEPRASANGEAQEESSSSGDATGEADTPAPKPRRRRTTTRSKTTTDDADSKVDA